MNDNKPIYIGGWQIGDTIREELKGPIGDGEVTYPNGDRFKGYFHLSYANINGPAYAAEGRYDFADGSYIEKAWINTGSDRITFNLHGVFTIHHPEGHDTIAMFFKNKRTGFELVLTEKPYAIEWYDGERQRDWEIECYDIAEPDKDCLTLTLTLKDGTRIVQSGGSYSSNSYGDRFYEPHTKIIVYLPNGDSIDQWKWGLKSMKPYDGNITVHCAETQMFRDELWEKGTCVEAKAWNRDSRAAKYLALPEPFGKGEKMALVWQDGHIVYFDSGWTYEGEVKDDKPEGHGVLTSDSYRTEGQHYEGEFHEGLVHGLGVFENTKAGIRQEGTFVNGVYQEPNAAEPVILHARHEHSSWSISSQGKWDYEKTTFEITHDREFLKHFLTRWRTLSLSPEMVERLKNSDDYYACYGYGRWLYYANPDGNSLKLAQEKLELAANMGEVADALAALAEMHYIGAVAEDKTDYQQSAFLMYKATLEKSELAQYQELYSIIYGNLGFKEDPDETADILIKHLEKHPDSDPIYWDLLGLAVSQTDKDEAMKYYKKSIMMGNNESYYSLAKYYYDQGDMPFFRHYVEEGVASGAVNCHRALATFMTNEDYDALPEEEQKKVHEEMDSGLRYAIDHYDRIACYLLAFYTYYGQMGFEADTADAMRIAKRGCELGESLCFELLAQIYDDDEDIPDKLRISQKEIAKLYLQALRRGGDNALGNVADAYVVNLLPDYEDEIEGWLPQYYEQATADDDLPDSLGVLKIYPQGYFYATEVEQDKFDSLADLAQLIDAEGVDIVHYSETLNRMSKVLCQGEHKDCHIAMVVDRDGYAKSLPDNMAGTILYGHDYEVLGTVMLVLEDEKYNLLPIKGLKFFHTCVKMLNAATHGLTRWPTAEEQERIESANDDDDTAPKNITVKLADIDEELETCNLCRDTLIVVCPKECGDSSTNDLMLPIKDAVELNIKCNGGYMIDEWRFVDSRQVPTDIRSRVRFKLEGDEAV